MIPDASGNELVQWLLRRRKRLRVRGASMEPTLSPNDVVFVDHRAYVNRQPIDGDVVVAIHPQQAGLEIVKRVEFTNESGVYLVSDNRDQPDASDSRRFGMVPFELIIGRVTAAARAKI